MQAVYVVGVLACVYHLANGLWTFGITWGVWTAPRAQRWANVPCLLLGVFLAIVGMGALYGFHRVPPSPASEGRRGQSHFRGEWAEVWNGANGAAKIGTVPTGLAAKTGPAPPLAGAP